MKKLVLVLILLACCGCTRGDEAERVLMNQGYSSIEITGYRFLGCSDNDMFRTGFKAKSPTGSAVEGVVCSGIFKGATVRFD